MNLNMCGIIIEVRPMESRPFTDRESGTYGGLMLSLRDFRDRLVSYPGFQLNMKISL